MSTGAARSEVRLAEIVATLSLATDLGHGQPMEHVIRSCLLGLRLSERLGLDEQERAVVYYVGLLAFVGCYADAHEQARWFGDEIAARSAAYGAELAGLGRATFAIGHVGAGEPPLRRARKRAAFVAGGRSDLAGMFSTHCEITGAFAEQLKLAPAVRDGLHDAFERWDGRGVPVGRAGEEIAMAARLMRVARVAEIAHRAGGAEAVAAVARERRGRSFDPALADLLSDGKPTVLDELPADSSWDAVIAAEPALRIVLSDGELDAALEAIADFADLKSPYTLGHSRGVADLAADAGRRVGLDAEEATALRRAALLHDLGRLGVSNAIWDKPGPLSPAEWERVRLHPYLTQRMLASSRALAPLASIAAHHHERLDGSGYPGGLSGGALSMAARVLAAADVYDATTQPRPHRPARPPDQAAAELRGEVRAGRIDGDAADAVLTAAGHVVGRRRQEGPAGLTAREVEVLRLLARGLSNKEIADELVISRKTAGTHVEHIYRKIGVSSRAAASLFAVQHGLLP